MMRPKALDLSTVREVLAYMHDDLRRAPGFERAAAALATAIAEIERSERGIAGSTNPTAHARFRSVRALR